MQSTDQWLSNALIPKCFGVELTAIRRFEVRPLSPLMRDIISGMSQADMHS